MVTLNETELMRLFDKHKYSIPCVCNQPPAIAKNGQARQRIKRDGKVKGTDRFACGLKGDEQNNANCNHTFSPTTLLELLRKFDAQPSLSANLLYSTSNQPQQFSQDCLSMEIDSFQEFPTTQPPTLEHSTSQAHTNQ